MKIAAIRMFGNTGLLYVNAVLITSSTYRVYTGIYLRKKCPCLIKYNGNAKNSLVYLRGGNKIAAC